MRIGIGDADSCANPLARMVLRAGHVAIAIDQMRLAVRVRLKAAAPSSAGGKHECGKLAPRTSSCHAAFDLVMTTPRPPGEFAQGPNGLRGERRANRIAVLGHPHRPPAVPRAQFELLPLHGEDFAGALPRQQNEPVPGGGEPVATVAWHRLILLT